MCKVGKMKKFILVFLLFLSAIGFAYAKVTKDNLYVGNYKDRIVHLESYANVRLMVEFQTEDLLRADIYIFDLNGVELVLKCGKGGGYKELVCKY